MVLNGKFWRWKDNGNLLPYKGGGLDNMTNWTEKEKGIMRDFIKNNPEVKLKTMSIHPLLIGCFGDRTPEAVYHGWRRLKGLKRSRKTKGTISQDFLFDETPKFLSTIGEFIEEFITSQLDTRGTFNESILKSENEELRRTIHILTKNK
jgi:hypothetical protein